MRLDIAGNTPIICPRDPQVPMEAATKNYVDNSISSHASNFSLHLTTAQNTWIDTITASAVEVNYLSGVTSAIQTQLNSKVNLSGGTMTGAFTLAADPVSALQAVTKQYADAGLALKVAKAGDTMTGFLFLNADPTSNLHATTKQYVDTSISTHASDASIHITSAQNTLLDSLTVSSTEINQLSGISSNAQTQLNSKVNLSGGTMTGALALAADPASAMQATTKQYVDAADALKVAKAGDIMTGFLTLSADPTSNLHAASKHYVDTGITTHANDMSLHLTSGQNAMIDAITVTATEINQLSGISSNVQTQMDTKFAKAGGLVTGDITLDTNKTVFVSKTPVGSTEVVNKAYVDGLFNGRDFKDPVTDPNLVNDSLNVPPGSPVVNDVYIIGTSPTGAWSGKSGYATFWNSSAWVFLQARAVAIGDRFGVALASATTVNASLTAHSKKVVTITNATPGSIQYSDDVISAGTTILVFDPDSAKFGVSYTYTDEGTWVPTNTSVNISAGAALSFSGNLLNVNYDSSLILNSNVLGVNLEPSAGLSFSGTGKVKILLDGSSLTTTATGIKVSDSVMADIADRVSKTGTSSVSGSITIASGGSLKSNVTPSATNDVITKGYTDTAVGTVQTQVNSIQTTVNTLNTDPVTKTYVDTADNTKVSKAGSIMTGLLTLSGDPTGNLHAATKQYVDTGISTHANDVSIHLTTAQNTWIDAITASAVEVNYLTGVTSGVQSQLNSKLNLSGGTMTGALALAADPAAALQAATKQYVDAADVLKVAKAGDTMTGFLTLSANPTANLHAATKQYVDSGISTHATDVSIHLTTAQNTWIDAITASSAEVNYLVGVTSSVQTQLTSKVNLSGGTMTGLLTLSADPSSAMNAATKQYVDNADATKVAKAGDTMTGLLTLSGAPTANLHAATKQYTDTSITTLTTYVDTQDATKVAKAGDTMTGFLTLSADPTSNLHAASKHYVDTSITTLTTYINTQDSGLQTQISGLQTTVNSLNSDPVTKSYVDSHDNLKLNLTGGTMSGYIILHADPSQSMHPATKQYVDAVAQGLVTKPSVRFATTAALVATYNNGTSGVNATLTGSSNGVLSVDGSTPNVGDRILVRLQATGAENGDYTVQQVGDAGSPFILKRVNTVDESSEIPASYFYVFDGATLKGTGWVFTVANPVTFAIGTDAITVNQFSGQGSLIAGNGLTITGNTIDINTASSSRIVVNADTIDLATTGVTPNTYTKVTVDGYGRVTSGTNPNTLAGYGITDAQSLNANLTSLSAVSTAGIIVRDSTNALVTKQVTTAGVGISVSNGSGANTGNIIINSNATDANTASTIVSRDASGNFSANVITAALTGNASTATTLQTSRNFSITGSEVTASTVSFNGGADVALAASLTATGVTPGAYTKVTVDSKGRVTLGANPTTIAGYGITDAYTKAETDDKITALTLQVEELWTYILTRL